MKRKYLLCTLVIIILTILIILIFFFRNKKTINENPYNYIPSETQLVFYISNFDKKISDITKSMPFKILKNNEDKIISEISSGLEALDSINEDMLKYINKSDLYIAVSKNFPSIAPLYIVTFNDNKLSNKYLENLIQKMDKTLKKEKDFYTISLNSQNVIYLKKINNIILFTKSKINFKADSNTINSIVDINKYIKPSQMISLVCIPDTDQNNLLVNLFTPEIYKYNFLIINIPSAEAINEYEVIANPKNKKFISHLINKPLAGIKPSLIQYIPSLMPIINIWSAKNIFSNVIKSYLENNNLKNKWDSLTYLSPIRIDETLFTWLGDNICMAHDKKNNEIAMIINVKDKNKAKKNLMQWSRYAIKKPVYLGPFIFYPVKWGNIINFFFSDYIIAPDIMYAFLSGEYLLIANTTEFLEKMIATKKFCTYNANINLSQDCFQMIYQPLKIEINNSVEMKYLKNLKTDKPTLIYLNNFQLLDTNIRFSCKIIWDSVGMQKAILEKQLFDNEQIYLLEWDSIIAMKDEEWSRINVSQVVQMSYSLDRYGPYLRLKAEGRINEKGQRTGLWRYYYPNTNLWASISYIADKPDGNAFLYYNVANKKIKAIANFSKGELNGRYQEFYPNGAKKNILSFTSNNRNGVAKYYDKNGNLIIEGNYKDNKKIGTWHFYTTYQELIPWQLEY